jgi:hypothetical protein
MIPHTKDTALTIGGIDNATEFSIATTGKAFRILIDGLYSDKVLAPVRELMTNAVDAHVDAGHTAPFVVTVPTQMDPTFGVRDFGTGMDHDTIVGLYTTLFASSKDDTNEQTGMLGLGSKSPFAYTDTFTVEAFDGTTKRTYMTFMKDDVPNISLVGESPSTEPRGIHVQFPVDRHDRRAFEEAIYKVIAGLDVVPLLDGVELDTERLPEVVREGAGWRIIKGGEHDEHVFVRQGGVLYPLRREYARPFPTPRGYYDHYSLVFDVPIGACEVTPSREALAYDEQTVANIQAVAEAAFDDMVDQIQREYNAIGSQYDHYQWLKTIPTFLREDDNVRSLFPSSALLNRFDLMPSHFTKAEKWDHEDMKREQTKNRNLYPLTVKDQTLVTHIDHDAVNDLIVVLDDGVSPRRRSRMLDWAGSSRNRRLMIPTGPYQGTVVKRMKALMHLRDDQFISVADLYDPGPRSSGRSGSKGIKKSEMVEKLENGAIWCERKRNDYRLLSHDGERLLMEGKLDKLSYEMNDLDGVDYSEVLFLTTKQVESLNPPWEQSLTKKVLDEAYKLMPNLFTYQNAWQVERTLRDAKCSHPQILGQHLGFTESHAMRRLVESHPPIVRQAAAQATRNLHLDTEALVSLARTNYPALFPEPLETEVVADYLAMQDEIHNNPTTEEV